MAIITSESKDHLILFMPLGLIMTDDDHKLMMMMMVMLMSTIIHIAK